VVASLSACREDVVRARDIRPGIDEKRMNRKAAESGALHIDAASAAPMGLPAALLGEFRAELLALRRHES
jgi:hypothetical protein